MSRAGMAAEGGRVPVCPQFGALATPWSWLLGRHPLAPSSLPGSPASPGLSLNPTGHRNGAPDSALYPLTPNQPLPCRAGISPIDPPPPPCLLGSEMHPSCPLQPLISFRKGFPFRTERQLKPGPAPAASRAMLCGYAAGGDLCTWLPRALPPVRGAQGDLQCQQKWCYCHAAHSTVRSQKQASAAICPGGSGHSGVGTSKTQEEAEFVWGWMNVKYSQPQAGGPSSLTDKQLCLLQLLS